MVARETEEEQPYLYAFRTYAYSAGNAIFTMISMIFVTGLCLYHTFLISSNQTTNENLKKSFYFANFSMFSRGGCCSNWFKL